MATLTIAGRSFEIAPYDIEEMILAAPYADAFSALRDENSFTQMLEALKNNAAILSVGLQKIDPSLTITSIAKMALSDPGGGMALAKAVRDVLGEFGLVEPGEAKAPAKPRKAAGASKKR